MNQEPPGQPLAIRCPTCGRPVAAHGAQRPDSFPFCDRRCRLRDLGAWLDGRHVIAGRDGSAGADDGRP